ncbi:MAG: ATPase [Pseudomonadota bacterium]
MWFELLTPRDQVACALEALAETGTIELEAYDETAVRPAISAVQPLLDEYHRLAQRYQAYWPQPRAKPPGRSGRPADLLVRALKQLRVWRNATEQRIRELEALQSEYATLQLLENMLQSLTHSPLDLGLLAHASSSLRSWALPLNATLPPIPPTLIIRHVQGSAYHFLLAIGPPQALASLDHVIAQHKGRKITLPPWIQGNAGDALVAVERRKQAVLSRIADLKGEMDALARKHHIAQALGIIGHMEWLQANVGRLAQSEHLAWITGWTNDLGGKRLEAAIQEAGIPGLLRFPSPPEGKSPPMIFVNPWWARPFELFTRLLGTPARNEVDPTQLLSLMAPLLFGYMFGDVGQGFVFLLGGILLSSRWPAMRLLIPAGVSAMVFGLLFGSIFSREDLIRPVWLQPLDAPLTVLLIPIIAGIGILVLGMLLDALENLWAGAWTSWLREDAPILVLYLGIIAGFLNPVGLIAALVGLLWYLGGSIQPGEGWDKLARPVGLALGRVLEAVLQLAINTLSFARVGAFALAHTGLSLAIMLLAEAAAHPLPRLLILIFGNILIIVLEGIVVSVQTTRLILFEFFIRFWRGQGRAFRPIPPPLAWHNGKRSKT